MSTTDGVTGLPDDTPERWTIAERMADGKASCSATSPGFIGFACTGPEGRDGAHFADGIERCIATWEDPA